MELLPQFGPRQFLVAGTCCRSFRNQGALAHCFPKQFTVGVLSSLLRGVRLFPGGGVRLSGCVRIHLSPSLAGGSVWLFEYFHLSPNSFVPVWLMVSGSPDICLQLSPFICLPVWLVVCGSLDVCLYLSPFMCPWLVVSGSPDICLQLSPSLAGAVRLFGYLSSLASLHLSPYPAGGARLSGMSVLTCLPSFVSPSG